jgi:hypothetical protein
VAIVTDLKRFRQLVRSRVRGRVAQTKEPPALTLYASAGARASKATVVPVGAARSAREVAENVRVTILEKRPAFAAIVSTTTSRETGKRSRGVAVVVAARTGEVETWQSEFRAGDLAGWEPSEFDPGSTLDLLRQSWAELGRVEHLEGLVERLRAIGEGLRDGRYDQGVTDEAWAAARARLERVGELGEGCMSFLGDPAARPPRENERDFTAYTARWVEEVEKEMGIV